MKKNILGPYGAWAAGLIDEGPGPLSWRRSRGRSLAAWKKRARARVEELMAAPDLGGRPPVRVEKRYEYDGLAVEELSWAMPSGPRTAAVFIKPAGARGRLPGLLALHDHGGIKYFGTRKIVRLPGRRHPLMAEHQRQYYQDTAWANRMARAGYAVLVHDGFLFGSRRIRYQDVPPVLHGDRREKKPDSSAEIRAYNQWAAGQESVVAKSLFCAGTTWPGVFWKEDQKALDYLCARRDVDPERVGCGGLSGGGLRTVFLAGLDDRIKAAVCAGFMSTWKDFLLHKSFTHTWMSFLPLLPAELEFPEILGLRVPLPTMVLNCTEDPLYSVAAMRAADRILTEVFARAEAPHCYAGRFYRGGHTFDLAMQQDALAWWDAWLK